MRNLYLERNLKLKTNPNKISYFLIVKASVVSNDPIDIVTRYLPDFTLSSYHLPGSS